MLGRRALALVLLLAAAGPVACGDGDPSATPTKPATGADYPTLAARPASRGEIVVKGESSPATRGPYAFDGTYSVRFAQIAPEDPKLDFSGQTPFTATLERRQGDPHGAIKLFSAARASGRRKLRIHGRYLLDVSFGDFPYAMRFTPRG
jgi:hypothetical protein